MNVDAAGLYAAGYDLAQQGVGLLLATVQVAAYPLAVRAMENEGAAAAKHQMKLSGEMIFFLACSAAGVLCAIPEPIATVVVGPEFRESTAQLLPIVGIAAALFGMKAFHFDMGFHLQRNSRPLVVSSAVAAALNVALNILAIPRFGIVGAAYATVISFGVGLLLSAWWGQSLPQMPPIAPLIAKGGVFFVAAFLSGELVSALPLSAFSVCILASTVCAFVCAAVAWSVDLAGVRQTLRAAVLARSLQG